jgi:hypothetical protein
MTQIIEITQLAVISLASIIAIGAVFWVIYKIFSNK